jgi:hypothetical protein
VIKTLVNTAFSNYYYNAATTYLSGSGYHSPPKEKEKTRLLLRLQHDTGFNSGTYPWYNRLLRLPELA